MLQGIYTALITPFRDNKFSPADFKKLLDRQINAGVSGVVPCGTTGESPTLSHAEHNEITKLCVEYCAGKIQTIAGTGSNSTDEAIALTKHAEKYGADAALIVTPYYNKPSQEGLYQHFKAIHDNSNIPIVIYNIPGRCIVNVSLDLLEKLAKLPRVIAVKDATADLSLPSLVRDRIGTDFIQLSGEDATILPFYIAGGSGCISVTSNIVPELYVEMQNLWSQGNIKAAMAIQYQLTELNKLLFCETNPIPVKYAAHIMGLCSNELRLPLTEVKKEAQQQIKDALKKLNII